MSKEELYPGREQTLVKHIILENYLERFAHIIGHRWDTITYVDCFSGPWKSRSLKLEDTSFSIALAELRRARKTHADPTKVKNPKVLKLRCFFLEKDKAAYAKLDEFARSASDAEVRTRHATFEDSIANIHEFVRAGGQNSFAFLFIDPTGWTGFPMETIAPLLRIQPGEVLVNFMTSFIRRVIESPDEATQASLDELFGRHVPKERFKLLSGIDLDDALAEEYSRSIASVGDFKFVRTAIVLHPQIDKTHFHLIYATRHPKGVEVFKAAEKSAMKAMETARADAKQRKRETSGQQDLFESDVLDSSHYDWLRERYTSRARQRVLAMMQAQPKVAYDDAWDSALTDPLVWESDLKTWIDEWRTEGLVRIPELVGRESVAKRGKSHMLVWCGSSPTSTAA